MKAAQTIPRILSLTIFLTGCVDLTPTAAPLLPSPTLTQTSTSTFVMPTLAPTPTDTPRPIPSATIDPQEGLDMEVLRDDFETNAGWELTESGIGATSILQGRLIITLSQSRGFRYAIAPVDSLEDFYLQVEVRPDLCQPDDEFGVLYRIDSDLNHYRFGINCKGEVRVSRILQTGSRSLMPLEINSAVIPGPKAVNILAVRTSGDRFHFWVNGFEVGSIRDLEIKMGLVGLYVRTGRGDLATVTFDNLLIQVASTDLVPTPTGETTSDDG